jgi:hypothetical protein
MLSRKRRLAPEAEIIKRFTEKEKLSVSGPTTPTGEPCASGTRSDGQPSGEFVVVTQPARMWMENISRRLSNGRTPPCSIFFSGLRISRVAAHAAFPVTSQHEIRLKYLGKEQVDEIDCYIFQ